MKNKNMTELLLTGAFILFIGIFIGFYFGLIQRINLMEINDKLANELHELK